ncbi:MAG: SAM-dependent methyltransferase [Proteobacteria bacterium TMED72]|nr:class I SAM-dependent methyltransferase [bacterium]RPG08413.1 MAG: SAM-dependent methyltransferase [Proteobacteria bacterium TMED72]RPG20628.1 MAG: SAM-dependent methyltransferase [Phycisphaera sp. TMED9]RPG20874.1 MAG: SAM-dependent methyltransferase [Phycisphaera sp. TMED9]
MLGERLANRMRHLSKWGRKKGISCFRLYERDVPEYPAIVDWYADENAEDPTRDGDAIVWLFGRKRDDTLEKEAEHRRDAEAEILAGLNIPRERMHVKHRGRQSSGSGEREQYERVDTRATTKVVREHGLRFEINLSDYLDVGLFLDHRPTRKSVQDRADGKRVLNLFAYTGAFSVHARAGGADATTTVDMSRTYLDWYERNLALNGHTLEPRHRVVQADCLQWLEAGPQDEDDRYDIVVCDPPTFSNSKRMKAGSFSIDRDHPALLRNLARFVAPKGEIFFSTNSRSFELSSDAVPANYGCREISNRSVPEDFRNQRIHRCWRLAEGWERRR